MAAKNSPKSNKSFSAPKPAPTKVAAPAIEAVKSTEVRNSPIPKTPAKREITREMIAKRAFEIFAGGTGSSEDQNWLRAERELRAGL